MNVPMGQPKSMMSSPALSGGEDKKSSSSHYFHFNLIQRRRECLNRTVCLRFCGDVRMLNADKFS